MPVSIGVGMTKIICLFLFAFYVNRNITKEIVCPIFDYCVELSTPVLEEKPLTNKIFNLMCKANKFLWCYIFRYCNLILIVAFAFFLTVEANATSVVYNDMQSIKILMHLISKGSMIFSFLG